MNVKQLLLRLAVLTVACCATVFTSGAKPAGEALEELSAEPIQQQPEPAGRITGIVTDESGEPLTGASVVIRGNASKGTITGADGGFSINGVAGNDVIEVMFLGYISQSVPVDNKRDLNIVMTRVATQIDELVVVGYGTQKRSDITGSVSSVKASELTSAPAFSASQALQGRVAGVVIQNNSGDPTGTFNIRIRGANSLQYGNAPLVIIDGVQGGNIHGLNPYQIESMEVLKDAAALSIYGSSGANGVILITTKTGKSERAQISYNGFVSIDNVAKIIPTLEAWEYATLYDEYREENNLPEMFGAEAISRMGKGTNWQSEIFRTAVSYNHNLSVGGSKKVVSYYVAADIAQREGTIINTDYDQYTVRGNLKAKATKRLDLAMNAVMSYAENNKGATPVESALQWSPTKPIYDSKSTYGYSQPGTNGIGPVSGGNPVASAREAVNESFGHNAMVSLKGDYRLWDWLKVSSQIVYNANGSMNGYFDNQKPVNGANKDISGYKSTSSSESLQNTNILTFDNTWNGHNVQATGVYEISKGGYNATNIGGSGIPVDMGYQGIPYASTRFDPPGSGYSKSATQSVMARVNYAYNNKYLLSGSFRRDGASQLSENNKFENFWAFSGGWNLMEEKFMAGIKPVLSEFKLRASYGEVGNAAVPAYSSLLLLSSGLDAYNNTVLRVKQAKNDDLKWERTAEFNICFDARLWNGRLDVTVEYYSKETTGLLMWQKVASVTNVDQVLRNIGSVSNKGWDFTVSGTPFSNRDFSWTTNWTLNLNKNKILALDGNDRVKGTAIEYPGMGDSHWQIIGQPMSTFCGYTFLGTWKSDEVSTAAMYGFKPGDNKFADLNGDGKLDSEDEGIIGNAQPKGVFGINNTFRYKNFDLNIFFQGVWGNDIYNLNRVRRETYGDVFPTSPSIRDHWTPANETDMPAFSGRELLNSSRWVENGSYLRLKNLSLGYRFPEKWMSKIHVSLLRIYVSGTNLWTITNYSGYNPEASVGLDANAGVDINVYPSLRSCVFGIDLTF